MALRVAFDLDGTIADMHTALRSEAERLFGGSLREHTGEWNGTADGDDQAGPPVVSDLALSPSQQLQLWDHVKGVENFWTGLAETDAGIVARIAQTADARRWEVIFLTTRPFVAGETVQTQSQRWLQAHGFPFPSVFVVRRSRGRIADALELDAVVDDRPENCLDVALDSKATAILIWQDDPKTVPLAVERASIRVVSSISEALETLIELDQARVRRVRSPRKLFGRETTA
jgi:hypothetical protein